MIMVPSSITSSYFGLFLSALQSPVLPLFIVLTSFFLSFLHHSLASPSSTLVSECLRSSQECYALLEHYCYKAGVISGMICTQAYTMLGWWSPQSGLLGVLFLGLTATQGL